MANNDNLLKGNPQTQFKAGREQVETARKGGIASGKSKREKKALKDAFEALLNMPMKGGKDVSLDDVKNLKALKGKNISVQEAIAVIMVQKALKGDIRAAEFVRDSSGQRPDESMKLEMSVPVMFGGENELED